MMSSLAARQAAPHALHELKSLLEAKQRAKSSSAGCHEAELEIDIDREIGNLVFLSGLAHETRCDAHKVQVFIAWIAGICAETADRGGGHEEMRKATAIAVRRHAQSWRNLACLLARRCATLTRHYGVEEADGPSGEVIRWLFVDAEPHPNHCMH